MQNELLEIPYSVVDLGASYTLVHAFELFFVYNNIGHRVYRNEFSSYAKGNLLFEAI
jgi:hypothetical protein